MITPPLKWSDCIDIVMDNFIKMHSYQAIAVTEWHQLILYHLLITTGSDWRMFAQRVGVPDSLIEQWQQMKVHQPMRNALGVWAASSGATVRILHRHLVSPQMRCVLLAKRVSDYYQVDWLLISDYYQWTDQHKVNEDIIELIKRRTKGNR